MGSINTFSTLICIWFIKINSDTKNFYQHKFLCIAEFDFRINSWKICKHVLRRWFENTNICSHLRCCVRVIMFSFVGDHKHVGIVYSALHMFACRASSHAGALVITSALSITNSHFSEHRYSHLIISHDFCNVKILLTHGFNVGYIGKNTFNRNHSEQMQFLLTFVIAHHDFSWFFNMYPNMHYKI